MNREQNVALFTLRALQVGLTLEDLDYLSHGQVVDIITEFFNDDEQYELMATQKDFDRF